MMERLLSICRVHQEDDPRLGNLYAKAEEGEGI